MTDGTVAVTADEAGRYTQFAMCMQGLRIPAGSKTVWQVGNDIPGNRNAAIRNMAGDWIWFIDDDHAFHADILIRLLQRDVDIVAPLVLRRQQPFHTVACVDDEILRLNGKYPSEGLVEVEATGSAGMLIRREVLDAIPRPWFELGNGVSEDISFCQKAREQGASIFVDLGVQMGHITTCAIWPTYDDEKGWMTGMTIADGCQLKIDPA